MELIWKNEKIFLKDLVECFADPKPAVTTIATLLKRMQEKGFVGYNVFGNSRQYFALVMKEEYFSKHLRGIIKNNFGNSALQFASFFTQTGDFTTSDLEDLRKIIDQEIDKKKK
jgi:predicted transcriptional regulator